MRKFFRQMFYVPKYGKMEESAFMARIAGSVTIIFLCLTAMSFAAYAYFSCSVTSGVNVIQAASFTLDVNDAPIADSYVLTGGEKEFKLSWSERTTASVGYGKMLVYDSEGKGILTLYTQPFTSESDTCTITFSVPSGAEFTVRVIAEWGTCALRAEAIDGKTVDLSPFAPPVEEDQEPVGEGTDDNSADDATDGNDKPDDSGNGIPDEERDDAEPDDIPEGTDDLITGEDAGENTDAQPEDDSQSDSQEDLGASDTDPPAEETESEEDLADILESPEGEQTEEPEQESAEETGSEAATPE